MINSARALCNFVLLAPKEAEVWPLAILVVNHPLEVALGQGLGREIKCSEGFTLQRCCAVNVALLSHITTAFLGQTARFPDLPIYLSKAANGYVSS